MLLQKTRKVARRLAVFTEGEVLLNDRKNEFNKSLLKIGS
jgi:hypothetical protein